jgi:hypothetical protein
MKRVALLVSIGLLLLLLFAWWYSQHEWLTDRVVAQVKLGMTRAQVEALLGTPEKDYIIAAWPDSLSRDSLDDNAQVELMSPYSTWLPALTANGRYLRNEKNVLLSSDSGDRRYGRLLESPCIWVGRERSLVLLIDDSDGVLEIRAFPVKKEGGGFFYGLSDQWNSWVQRK